MSAAFAVVADPSRRAILDLLLEGPRAVGDLVERLQISQPLTSKHLRVLRDAGLVHARKDGRRRLYELRADPLADVDTWLEPYRREWATRLGALEEHLDSTGGP
jgi:DNA-binding transcriptional ArsR family regulator